MKKLTCMLMLMALIFCCSGCKSGEEEQGGGNIGHSFTYNGTVIPINGDAAPIIAALGEPKSYTEETSCAFDGLDKTYYYGSFYLTTYPMEGKDYVNSLWFVDDSISTEEGIHIGSERAEVERIYGAESFDGNNACILIRGETKLTILITDGFVSSIQYGLMNP